MAQSRRKKRGSSKAGRPRKEGARYPSGKLKPPTPNETVLAKRKIGDAEAGEHPLDFALSQKWITERQHKDAMAYRAAYNRSHISGPRLSRGGLSEAPESERLKIAWAQMTDQEITEIFDRAFGDEPLPGEREQLERASLERWKRLNLALKPAEREQMFLVCILGSWPFWMPKRAAERALGQSDREKEEALMNALGAVGRAMRPPKTKGAVITSLPYKASRSARSEVPVRYVTEEGAELQPESERGVAFEVSILRKRA